MGNAKHWDQVYDAKGDAVSWFRPQLDLSLRIIDELALPEGATAIDVGSGASTLVDDLLRRGFSSVSVADLSQVALDKTRARLGEASSRVDFRVGDITELALPENAYDLWHDRAVFHFLTDPAQRERYVGQVLRALKPGGRIIVATFGPQGPEKCSGLPVQRYDDDALHATFGRKDFDKIGSQREVHETPWGSEQEFVYCYCRCETC